MDLKQVQSQTIDFLRLPLAVLVVFIHTSQTDATLSSIDYSNLSGSVISDILTVVFSKTIATIAVPLFFAISGYLFFINVKRWEKNEYFSKLKSRIKTLFVPYLVWNAIVLALSVGRALYIYYTSGEVNYILDQLSTVLGWLKPFWNQSHYGPITNALGQQFYITFPYNGPFWFIRDLIGMCLISPIIYLVVRYTKVWGLVLLVVALYTSVWIHIPGFGIEAFTYFSIGAYFGVHKKNLIVQARKIKIPTYIICAIAFVFSLYGNLPDIGSFSLLRAANLLFVFTGGVSIINIVSYSFDRGFVKVNPILSKSSFMVFAAHGLMLSVMSPLCKYIFTSDSVISAVAHYFLLPLSVSALCVLLYYVVVRYFPCLAVILVGSRSVK